MEIIGLLLGIIFAIGLTLGVGSSTFALTNFIVALQDGVIDDSEKRLMKVVYVILRIGMGLLAFGLIVPILLYGIEIVDTQYLMAILLLVIITVNAILMTKRTMPMQYGPVLAGGSWYSLFLLTELPFYGVALPVLAFYYVAFVVVFYFVFEAIKKKYLPQKPIA